MFLVAKLSVLSLTFSPAFAAIVPRCTPPTEWATDLESYDLYHARYMDLSCHTKHGTTFFDQCCHPLLRDEKPESRLSFCDPKSQSEATDPFPSGDQIEADLEDCDSFRDDDVDLEFDVPSSSRGTLYPPRSVEDETLDASALEDTTDVQGSSPDASRLQGASASAKTAGTVYRGGVATYYYQHGVAGACGKVHADTDLIAAIDADRYGDTGHISPLCGRKVRITNEDNHETVTVTIADACPTCMNSNSIDLSETAFKRIAALPKGVVPITWTFL